MRFGWAYLFLILAFVSAPQALAEDAPAFDKSGCSIFDPTPDDQMRSFETDRPTKSNSPYTVDCGHFQYEGDLVNWSYDRYNTSHTTTSNLILGDPVLKMGLTNNTDLEFALSPFNILQTHDRVMNVRNSYFGFGDITTRVKFNMIGNDGGDYILAVVPYVKAPTASAYIGNNHWEGGAYAPFSINLPQDWVVTFQPEMDILENAASNGTHSNFSNLVNLSHPLFDPSVTGYVEFWSDVDNDIDTPNQYTADFSLSWEVRDNLQLDVGVNLGLNKAAEDLQSYAGISQRF